MTQETDKTESSTREHGDVDMIKSSQAWPDSHGDAKFFYGNQEVNVKLVPHDSDAKRFECSRGIWWSIAESGHFAKTT